MEPQKFKTRKRIEHRSDARFVNFTCFHNQGFLSAPRACVWTLQAIERARQIHGFDLWAYCIMPEHLHLLILPAHGTTVSPILTSIKQSVANRAVAWTRKYAPHFLSRMSDVAPDGRTCLRFWQRGGGYDRSLWTREHIWDAIDYIHGNPVEAELCERATSWVWSSARFFKRRYSGEIACTCPDVPGVMSLIPDVERLRRWGR